MAILSDFFYKLIYGFPSPEINHYQTCLLIKGIQRSHPSIPDSRKPITLDILTNPYIQNLCTVYHLIERKGPRGPGRGRERETEHEHSLTGVIVLGKIGKPTTGSILISISFVLVRKSLKTQFARHPWLPRLFILFWTLLHWCRNPGRGSRPSRHGASSTNATCGASEVSRWSSPNTTPGADIHEAGAGGSLPRVGPSAGWRPAGPPELAWPEGHPCRSPIHRPRPADEDGSTGRPGGLRGPLWEDSGGVRLGLIPLLMGEAQVAAQQLPVANLLAYDDLKWAILQRVGRNPEQHRKRFRSVELGDNGRPFVMAQQLQEACRKWLMAEPRDVEEVVDLVVLEQFIARLPRGTAEWVKCHCPTSLTQAIQLTEDHLVMCPGCRRAPY